MNSYVKTIGLGAGGILVAVAIYLTGGATANNYQSAILNHLVDIVRGNSTITAVALNAPAWSSGIPLSAPFSRTVATTSLASSDVASSTSFTFAVAALDGTGTTTLSSAMNVTTAASTTHLGPIALQVTWAPIAGATGYAVFFDPTANATSFSKYFLATTTSAYTFSTSTGAFAGSDTLAVGTAFSVKLSPNASSYIAGANGTATTSPAASSTALQVNGNLMAAYATTTANASCYAAINGQIFYSTANGHLWVCEGAGATWTVIK